MNQNESSIERWIDLLRKSFKETYPNYLETFEIYAEEAIFGRKYISMDLQKLSDDAEILEIGAGFLILSCQLVREGFNVTALEPVGLGFSHFNQMREVIIDLATEYDCLPSCLNYSAEELDKTECYDFVFSINVMEHVADVEVVLKNVRRCLTSDATYLFTAPNYLFPYEPHFNIPTLFSKKATELVFKKKISEFRKDYKPEEVWTSLNWITVPQVRRIVRKYDDLQIEFNRQLFVETIERMETDPNFRNRRSLITTLY